ncbi:MAG: winged helix-turn-helix domain-containing protein [Halobacteriota archaeon]
MPSVCADDDDDAEPPDLFDLLSDATRRRIIEELYVASEPTLRFSELTRRVGVRDSGRFNYHLSRLRGSVVERTDEGYRLTDRGELVAGAVFDQLEV